MSRWMIPFWWACWIAWQTGTNSSSRSRGRELVAVAILGDRDALDQLHDEVGPAGVGGAGVEDLGDVGVVHQRQRLPLGLEAGDDLAGVHARLDDLERDLAADGLLLLGHVDDAHAAFADLLEQLVGADTGARPFQDGLVRRAVLGGRLPRGRAGLARVEESLDHRRALGEATMIFLRIRLVAGLPAQLALDPHQLRQQGRPARLIDLGQVVFDPRRGPAFQARSKRSAAALIQLQSPGGISFMATSARRLASGRNAPRIIPTLSPRRATTRQPPADCLKDTRGSQRSGSFGTSQPDRLAGNNHAANRVHLLAGDMLRGPRKRSKSSSSV